MAVAEAARNLVCVGAEPIAITDGLNFGNPERPDVYYQIEQCICGIAEACRVLAIPVISGNVSLYNESRGQAIYPTPIVGGLGLLDQIEERCTPGFKQPGDLVFLLGDPTEDPASLGGSEYLAVIQGRVEGQPRIDLELERRLQLSCLEAVRAGWLRSAHDCSDGGLAVALAECCILGGIGFKSQHAWRGHTDAILFGEAPSRIVVSASPNDAARVQALAERHQVPLTLLGVVGGEELSLGRRIGVAVRELEGAWRGGLEAALTAG